MTAVLAPASATPATPAQKRKSRRKWPRAVAPFAVLLVLFLVTWIAHAIEEPDLGDAGTLSPTGTGADGSSELARLLEERGVPVRRVTSASDAVTLASGQPSTVLVPAPKFISPLFYDLIADLPGRHRIVVLQPDPLHLFFSDIPAGVSATRWAARTTGPNCDLPAARDAGRAAVFRNRYVVFDVAEPRYSCYRGGLVGVPLGGSEVVLVGANDPFRNSRVHEHGNAALATGLLSGAGPVIWVDVHKAPRANLELPDLQPPEYKRPDRDRGGDSLWDTVPPLLPATLALAGAVAVLIGLARGRRLGPPVAEPLPVVVPAIETVAGRGRLYERSRAREAALTALRTAAVARLMAAFRLDDRDALLDQVAARARVPREYAHQVLFGPSPTSDEELTGAVAALDALERAVIIPAPPPGTVHRGGTP